MLFKSAKINEFRLWGLLLTMGGMAIMIAGMAGLLYAGSAGRLLMGICLVLGMIIMLGSVAVYFWAGMLSTTAQVVPCPECGRETKMLGKTDRCMYCKTKLTLDPKQATEGVE